MDFTVDYFVFSNMTHIFNFLLVKAWLLFIANHGDRNVLFWYKYVTICFLWTRLMLMIVSFLLIWLIIWLYICTSKWELWYNQHRSILSTDLTWAERDQISSRANLFRVKNTMCYFSLFKLYFWMLNRVYIGPNKHYNHKNLI